MTTKKTGKQKRIRNAEVDFDAFWKMFIENDFEDFMAFSYPKLHIAIDYDKTIEFLPKELHKIMADYGKKGTSTTDLLTKVFLKPTHTESGTSEKIWLLIHIEIEISPKSNFSFRMFSYFYRALDKYGKKVVALAVFPGDKAQPHHKYFEWERFGTKIRYEFNNLSVYDWTEEDLLQQESIVALALLASKRAVKTRGKYDMRYTYKRELLKLIKKRNYPLEKAVRLFNFVFFVMYLPNNLDRKLAKDIFEPKQEEMEWTQIPPEIQKRADVFFEVFVEKTTGKTYAEYMEDQKNEKKKWEAQVIQYKNQLEEIKAEKQKAEAEKQKAEAEKQKAETEKQKAETEKQKAETEKQKAETEKQKAETEKQKAEAEKLSLEQKRTQELKNTIYELSKLLNTQHIAVAMNMKEEEVIKIIQDYKNI